eukprot:6537607-Pyramimonas_sp.AAC.1
MDGCVSFEDTSVENNKSFEIQGHAPRQMKTEEEREREGDRDGEGDREGGGKGREGRQRGRVSEGGGEERDGEAAGKRNRDFRFPSTCPAERDCKGTERRARLTFYSGRCFRQCSTRERSGAPFTSQNNTAHHTAQDNTPHNTSRQHSIPRSTNSTHIHTCTTALSSTPPGVR